MTLDGTMLCPHREEKCKITLPMKVSVVVISPLWPVGLTPKSQSRKGVCTYPFCLIGRVPCPVPSPLGTDTAVGLTRCHMMHLLNQNKEVHIKSRTGEDIPKQRKMPIRGYEGSFSLCKETFWAQSTFLCDHITVK